MKKIGYVKIFRGNNLDTLVGYNWRDDIELEQKFGYWENFEEEVLEPFCGELGGTPDEFNVELMKS